MTTVYGTDRHTPSALLTLVQHIHQHDLGAPLTIHAPSPAAPYFGLAVLSASLDVWVASGFDLTDVTVDARPGQIAGRDWERVQYDGTLHGIRVQLVTNRPVSTLRAVPA